MSVLFEVRDRVARVAIDRPARLNAVDAATGAALEAVWRRLEADGDVRAVVLTGAGDRAFCAGADVSAGGEGGLDYWAHPVENGFGGLACRTTLDIPVIARVNGMALGGGFEMMLGCDIVVAVDDATFGLPEPRLGLLPLDGGMVLLQRQIPRKLAMGVLLTGRRFTAAEALDWGLVNEVVPRAGLDAAVDRWLADILACAPLSLRAIKQTAQRTAHLTPAEATGQRLPAVVRCLTSADAREGVQAFRERRKPVWTGR